MKSFLRYMSLPMLFVALAAWLVVSFVHQAAERQERELKRVAELQRVAESQSPRR